MSSFQPRLIRPAGRTRDRSHAGAIKATVREVLGLGPDETVVVQELACREPDCPPVETVLAVLDGSDRRWTLPKPLAEVSADDVRAALSDPAAHDHDHGDDA